MHRISIAYVSLMLLVITSCNSQEQTKNPSELSPEELGPVVEAKKEPHPYGGWYCPDNFGFVPVDISKLVDVPAVSHRLPTKEELHSNMSLIEVDTAKFPDARALDMNLPRIASIYDEHKGMSELIIVIQAIVVQQDTVVGYRFPNGGNGSAWISDVTFLSDKEVAAMGSQPFFFSKKLIHATSEDIWNVLIRTDYFKELGKKFDKESFFSSEYNPQTSIRLQLETESEKAFCYVGLVYGNYYLQIDYNRNGFHYSEKLFLLENLDDNTTEFFFASGPYPEDFEKQQANWNNWVDGVENELNPN